MDPFVISAIEDVLIVVVPALVTLGIAGIVAKVMISRNKGLSREQLSQLIETIEDIHHRVENIERNQVSQLNEVSGRLEFAERLLAGRKDLKTEVDR